VGGQSIGGLSSSSSASSSFISPALQKYSNSTDQTNLLSKRKRESHPPINNINGLVKKKKKKKRIAPVLVSSPSRTSSTSSRNIPQNPQLQGRQEQHINISISLQSNPTPTIQLDSDLSLSLISIDGKSEPPILYSVVSGRSIVSSSSSILHPFTFPSPVTTISSLSPFVLVGCKDGTFSVLIPSPPLSSLFPIIHPTILSHTPILFSDIKQDQDQNSLFRILVGSGDGKIGVWSISRNDSNEESSSMVHILFTSLLPLLQVLSFLYYFHNYFHIYFFDQFNPTEISSTDHHEEGESKDKSQEERSISVKSLHLSSSNPNQIECLVSSSYS